MKRILFFLNLILLTASGIFAQSAFRIKGVVLDDSTSLPVAGAFIVCQNTTIGTSSDADGSFSLSVPAGGHDIIIGSTGYENDSRRISASAGETEHVEIRLRKKVKQMDEVVVQASSEVADGWEKYGEQFRDYFLGKSPFAKSCEIENPTALKFYYLKRKKKLRVKADSAVIIKNKALGYSIRYMLDSFIYDYQTQFSIHSGVTLFTELEGSEEEKLEWKKNREDAYWGSRLHFMRSYYDSALSENGFLLEEVVRKDSSEVFVPLTNPYDSAFYERIDSSEIDVLLVGKYRLHYKDAPMHRSYLEANKYPLSAKGQLSTLELANGFAIMENGYFYEQRDVISSGYWAWKNLADQLPYDYLPEE
ncbi:MAG: carboxypeptidase-like regulatory domain-containing protein [Bacteroidota bacterium]